MSRPISSPISSASNDDLAPAAFDLHDVASRGELTAAVAVVAITANAPAERSLRPAVKFAPAVRVMRPSHQSIMPPHESRGVKVALAAPGPIIP